MYRLPLLFAFLAALIVTGCSAPGLASAPTLPAAATSIPAVPMNTPTSAETAAPILTGAPINTVTPMPTEAPTMASAPTNTAVPTAAPTNTVAPTPTPANVSAQTAPSVYLDDRSDGTTLMESFVNALNRKEYARAYSYWEPNAIGLAPFSQFAQGYANTASVQLTIGTMTGDVGAGQYYNSMPVIMVARTTSGQTQTFVGCYVTHLGSPSAQAVPPFQPVGFRSAQVQQVANNADTTALLANACQGPNAGGPLPPQPTFAPGDISNRRYLDDRSDPVEVIRSLYNAVNRFEYLRVYSYWESNAQSLPSFDQFQKGYADKASAQLTTGTVTSNAGAGQMYYQVPVTLASQLTSGATQTFVGCYTLHLSNPSNQTVPPFHPMAIQSARVTQVSNDANTAALMGQACH